MKKVERIIGSDWDKETIDTALAELSDLKISLDDGELVAEDRRLKESEFGLKKQALLEAGLSEDEINQALSRLFESKLESS